MNDDYYDKVKDSGLTQHQEDLIENGSCFRLECDTCHEVLETHEAMQSEISTFENKHRRCVIKLVK